MTCEQAAWAAAWWAWAVILWSLAACCAVGAVAFGVMLLSRDEKGGEPPEATK